MSGARLPGEHTYQHPFHSFEIEHATMVALRKEARERDMPVDRLIRDLLDAVATNRLTTTILGDIHPQHVGGMAPSIQSCSIPHSSRNSTMP
jgi:hypothetical protein